jgi:hypothetical protein
MVKNDNANGILGCKTTTGLVQMTASGQAKHNPTEKDLIFYHTLIFLFLNLPSLIWHIAFCPTHKSTLRKSQRAKFYQRFKSGIL